MTKAIALGAADAALNYVATNATRMTLCAGAPADAAAATTATGAGGVMLADLVLDAAARSGFAIDTAPTGTRRLSVGGQTALMGVENGTADHVAIVGAASGELLLVTELTEPQAILAGQIIATRSFAITVSEPS